MWFGEVNHFFEVDEVASHPTQKLVNLSTY